MALHSIRIKKLISIVLIILSVLNLFVSVTLAESSIKGFYDLPSTHWAYSSITALTNDGLFKGKTVADEYGYAYFGPEDILTCAELVTVIYRYIDSDSSSTASTYVPENHTSDIENVPYYWYNNCFARALSDGIISYHKYSIESFGYNVSRQEMAMFIVNALNLKGENIEIPSYGISIPDIDSADDEYINAIKTVYNAGIIQGIDKSGNFGPHQTVTRAQAAVILSRLINSDNRVKPSVTMNYIIHAGGAIDGYNYTNTFEAIENSYNLGNRYVEIDFMFSRDGHPICVHEWTNIITTGNRIKLPVLKDFLKYKIHDNYTPMWIGSVADYMRSHEDLFIITDTKASNERLLSYIATHYPDIMDRLIVQIYSEDQYDMAYNMGFRNIIFTTYNLSWELQSDPEYLKSFADTHKLAGYTFPSYMCYQDFINVMKQTGINLYTHTVDDPAEQKRLFSMGIDGIYTNNPAH